MIEKYFLVFYVSVLISGHLLEQMPLPVLWGSFCRERLVPIDVSYSIIGSWVMCFHFVVSIFSLARICEQCLQAPL